MKMLKKCLRMFLFILIVLNLAASMAGQARAVTYTGSMTANGGGITATDGWNSTSTILSWTVQDVGSSNGFILWQYDYTFIVPTKDISHMIIEVSPDAGTSDFTILSGVSSGGVDIYGPNLQGGSNPNMPGNMRGFKFDGTTLSESFSFTTTRAPVWGDFYANDGVFNPGQLDVTAWNLGLTSSDTDPSDGPSNGSLSNHILRPDTVQLVPEPISSTLFIIGGATLGIRRFCKKRKTI